MSLETAQYIHQLEPANPSSADRLAQGDDHIRMIKAALKATFPNVAGPITLTHSFLNALASTVVPIGAILMWHGSSSAIPEGFALCNGQTVNRSDGAGTIVTPDLRDRVPMGASTTNAVGAALGQKERTVTTGAAGAHTHALTVTGGAHTHNVTVAGNTGTSQTGVSLNKTTVRPEHEQHQVDVVGTVTLSDPGHSHVMNVSTTTGTTGSEHTHTATAAEAPNHSHSLTIDVTQPSVAVHFIMKI